MSTAGHTSVMVKEVVEALNIRPDGTYVDATFGRGGHTRAILECLGPAGRVLAIDRDPDACRYGHEVFANEPRMLLVQARFSDLAAIIEREGLRQRITGMVFDLGVSSPQLDHASRGFSFQKQGPLDMRMDFSTGETVADWLSAVEEAELVRVLRELGEERYAKRIARAVVGARGHVPLTTTTELAALISQCVPTAEPGKHPATRTFQALRIKVNGELDELDVILSQIESLLSVNGRLVVISFHSLEDRRVKHFFRRCARGDRYPPDLPITRDQIRPTLRLVGKLLRPTSEEVDLNPRARSAVMRVAERTAEKISCV
ncbi:MAG TPA: 16S rRNA (cytosine(1402)-N(4))-methyltransferase RsmH [Gammaproteobacteria bacterium]|nr:16S rRNA (cytosine(1402)-N(4))-methyltransferase RsmH [Gammaproteobacteria bacterium]HIN17259.1 16S rRNA (cytosine(1402)-N(4))-methyltransferase RsmH [Gammaproteobacteria bacterium]